MDKKTRNTLIVLGGSFFCIDQLLKNIANSHPDYYWYLIAKTIGWEYFRNSGIAFGIPIANVFIIITTLIILFCLIWFVRITTFRAQLGMTFLLAGAFSNLLDRIIFSYVIDYLRFITSMFNLADIYILTGIILLYFGHTPKKDVI